MPVEWEREGRTFIMRAYGSYASTDLMHKLDEIIATPDLPAGAGILLDVREAESMLQHSTREMRDIAEYFAANAAPFENRCALLVEGLARYGLMRMAAAWAELMGVDAGVFRDEDTARTWLEAKAQAAS